MTTIIKAAKINATDVNAAASNLVMPAALKTVIVSHGGDTVKASKSIGKVIDVAIAVGFDFIPKSKGGSATKEQWAEMQSLIALRFPKDAQALLKMDPNVAKERIAADHEGNEYTPKGQPKNRRYWTQQIGSVIGAYANAIKARQIRAAKTSDGAGERERTLDTRVIEDATKLWKAIKAADGTAKMPDDFDIDAALDGLAMAIKAAGGKAPRIQPKN